MTVSQMKTFFAVSQCMSFTEAAQRLFLSQPAVSRQMTALEEEIGTALFHRNHNVIFLTEAGQNFARGIEPILLQMQDLVDDTVKIGSQQQGRLRIGLLLDQSIDDSLRNALSYERKQGTSLTVKRMSFKEIDVALNADEIDLAVLIDQQKNAFTNFRLKTYAEEAMCLFIHKNLLSPEITESEQLLIPKLPVPILLPNNESFLRKQTDLMAQREMPATYAGFVEYDFSSISTMVASGLGSTIANESHILSVDSDIFRKPYPYLQQVKKVVCWKDKTQNALVSRFLENIQS